MLHTNLEQQRFFERSGSNNGKCRKLHIGHLGLEKLCFLRLYFMPADDSQYARDKYYSEGASNTTLSPVTFSQAFGAVRLNKVVPPFFRLVYSAHYLLASQWPLKSFATCCPEPRTASCARSPTSDSRSFLSPSVKHWSRGSIALEGGTLVLPRPLYITILSGWGLGPLTRLRVRDHPSATSGRRIVALFREKGQDVDEQGQE